MYALAVRMRQVFVSDVHFKVPVLIYRVAINKNYILLSNVKTLVYFPHVRKIVLFHVKNILAIVQSKVILYNLYY